MRIALYQPDIPHNTGSILRLAACVEVAVDIIGPAGFELSDRSLKRAGLDYLDWATLVRHESWAQFDGKRRSANPVPRLVLLSARSVKPFWDFDYRPDDILLFGRESAGVPAEVRAAADAQLTIPIRPGLRSLNLAVATAIVVSEALRQTRQST